MDNTKFNYLYRDAGNYKKWGSVVFANPDGLTLDSIRWALQSAFLQDGLFIAEQIRLRDVFFFAEGNTTSDDHCFHEFDGVEATLEVPHDKHSRTIGQFIVECQREAKRGWMAFDCHDRAAQRILF